MTSSERKTAPAYDRLVLEDEWVAMVAEGLHQRALLRSEEALNNGALRPLNTDIETWHGEGDRDFEIRHLVGAPPRHLRTAGPKPNPFLPWDERLEITRVGNEHVLILNKYPVQLGHMLLITRSWQPQEETVEAFWGASTSVAVVEGVALKQTWHNDAWWPVAQSQAAQVASSRCGGEASKGRSSRKIIM